MEILFESYGDGHREIVVDGTRYWVDETRSFQLSSTCPTGDRLPVRVIRHKCRLAHVDSENCWCNPTVEEYENGNRLIIHNGDN